MTSPFKIIKKNVKVGAAAFNNYFSWFIGALQASHISGGKNEKKSIAKETLFNTPYTVSNSNRAVWPFHSQS